MDNQTIALIISTSVLVVFLLYSIIYNHVLHKSYNYTKISTQKVEKVEEELIDDHFKEEEMEEIRDQIAAIDTLSEPVSYKPKVEPSPLSKKEEKALISKGQKILDSDNAELKPAFPVSDELRELDLKDLKLVLSSFDQMVPDQYGEESTEAEMGKGMLYDSISRKLNKIIKEEGWNQKIFIQAEKLETVAFEKVKRLEHKDFFETLNIMKEIGTIKDIVEIDPYTKLLIFTKEAIVFSSAGKVLISLIANKPDITLEEIRDKTKWPSSYLAKSLKDLEDLGIVNKKENQIIIEGLISEDEQRNLQQKLISVEQKRLEKEKDVEKLKVEREAKEKELEVKKEKEAEEKRKKEQQDLLQQTRKQAEQKSKQIVSQIDERTSSHKVHTPDKGEEPLDDMKSLEDMISKVESIENGSPEKGKKNKKSKKAKASSKKPQQEKQKSVVKQEEINAVLQVFDDIREMTGGIIILQGLQWYINQGAYPNMQTTELVEIMDSLKNQGKVYNEFTFSGVNLYVYENIEINEDMEALLRQFVVHGELGVEDIQAAVKWENERINQALHQLWNLNLMKMKENEKYFIPGLFNTQ